jgi:hypothetical protein
MRNIAYRMWEGCNLCVFGRHQSTPEEWGAYIQFLRDHYTTRSRALVVSHGGGLESYQRRELQELSELWPDRRVAIVTGSTFPLGVAKAHALLDPTWKVFSPQQMADALEYIGLRRTSEAEVKVLLDALTAAVAM